MMPEELKKIDIVGHLEELRRRILSYLAILIIATIASILNGKHILSIVIAPLKELTRSNLIFIAPAEAFTGYIKLALLAGFILSSPVLFFHIWKFLSPAISRKTRNRILVWFFASLLLFFMGVSFSYFIAIPSALKFLISFGLQVADANITMEKYIGFFSALVLIGGIIFEIPTLLAILADAKLVHAVDLRKNRHYAILAILIFAAIITPTQDIFNLLLFSIPMILLYEVGIAAAGVIEMRKSQSFPRKRESTWTPD